jgi:hypothetical protein
MVIGMAIPVATSGEDAPALTNIPSANAAITSISKISKNMPILTSRSNMYKEKKGKGNHLKRQYSAD